MNVVRLALLAVIEGLCEIALAQAGSPNPLTGSWAIVRADVRIDDALFSNWEGTEQRRRFALSGDELTYNIPNPVTAANKVVIVWRRLRE